MWDGRIETDKNKELSNLFNLFIIFKADYQGLGLFIHKYIRLFFYLSV